MKPATTNPPKFGNAILPSQMEKNILCEDESWSQADEIDHNNVQCLHCELSTHTLRPERSGLILGSAADYVCDLRQFPH